MSTDWGREMAEKAIRLAGQIARHRERYIRAWYAAYGVPEGLQIADLELVQRTQLTENGVEMISFVRKRSDSE